jgi:hypothetical protein
MKEYCVPVVKMHKNPHSKPYLVIVRANNGFVDLSYERARGFKIGPLCTSFDEAWEVGEEMAGDKADKRRFL